MVRGAARSLHVQPGRGLVGPGRQTALNAEINFRSPRRPGFPGRSLTFFPGRQNTIRHPELFHRQIAHGHVRPLKIQEPAQVGRFLFFFGSRQPFQTEFGQPQDRQAETSLQQRPHRQVDIQSPAGQPLPFGIGQAEAIQGKMKGRPALQSFQAEDKFFTGYQF